MFPRRLRSKTLRDKRKSKIIKFCLGALFFAVIILGTIFYIFSLESLKIKDIIITGTKFVDQNEIRDLVTEKLNKKALFIISRDNFLVYPKSKIVSDLLTKYPEIKNISLNLNKGGGLDISVTERVPVGLWCKSLENDNECFYLDDSGYIFMKAGDFSDSPYIKYYGDINGDSIRNTYHKGFFPNILNIIEEFKKYNYTPYEVFIDGYDDIKINFNEGFHVLLNKNDDEPLSDRLILLFAGEKPLIADVKDIEYIDLRFENKIYFKEWQKDSGEN